MPSHPDRVRQNYCEHEWITQLWAYNFLVCSKCGGLTQDKIDILYSPEKKRNL